MFNRKTFFALTGLDVDTHNTRKRHDHMPLLNPEPRTYTAFEALTFNIADQLASLPDGAGMNRTKAASIVRDAARPLAQHGPEIAASAEVFRLKPGAPVFHIGSIATTAGNVPFVGKLSELAAAVSDLDALEVVLTNATAAMAVLMSRASREGIDLSKMWPDPASLPSAEDRAAEVRASWADAFAKARRDG